MSPARPARPASPARPARPARPALPPLAIAASLVPVVDALRLIILETIPGVEERIYAGRTSAGYHDAHAGAFCGLFTGADVARLEFPRGVRTPKPERILKEGRYVQFRAGQRVPRAALVRVLHGALMASL